MRDSTASELGLSVIAMTFMADLLLPREDLDLISCGLVAVSAIGARIRATSWLKDHQFPTRSSPPSKKCWQKIHLTSSTSLRRIHSTIFTYEIALDNKRIVLLEKLATMNCEQYQKLVLLAEQWGVVLIEVMWIRYLPATRYFHENLPAKIGHVKRVFSDFWFPIAVLKMPVSYRFLDKKAVAGAILYFGVYAFRLTELPLCACSATRVVHADSIAYDTGNDHTDDINAVVFSRPRSSFNPSATTAIATTRLSGPWPSKPSFGDRRVVRKLAPSVRIEGTKAQVLIPLPPIRLQHFRVQWYGREHVDEKGFEVGEVIERPVVRGWGTWYQADVIAKVVRDRESSGHSSQNVAIGGDESLRVLGWLDDARNMAGVTYNSELEAV